MVKWKKKVLGGLNGSFETYTRCNGKIKKATNRKGSSHNAIN